MKELHQPDTIVFPVPNESVKSTAIQDSLRRDSDAEADRLLRIGNGIRDAVVFPRLRAMGVPDSDAELHAIAMRLVRDVQAGRDTDGSLAALLGVVRTGINGTVAMPEVV